MAMQAIECQEFPGWYLSFLWDPGRREFHAWVYRDAFRNVWVVHLEEVVWADLGSTESGPRLSCDIVHFDTFDLEMPRPAPSDPTTHIKQALESELPRILELQRLGELLEDEQEGG